MELSGVDQALEIILGLSGWQPNPTILPALLQCNPQVREQAFPHLEEASMTAVPPQDVGHDPCAGRLVRFVWDPTQQPPIPADRAPYRESLASPRAQLVLLSLHSDLFKAAQYGFFSSQASCSNLNGRSFTKVSVSQPTSLRITERNGVS